MNINNFSSLYAFLFFFFVYCLFFNLIFGACFWINAGDCGFGVIASPLGQCSSDIFLYDLQALFMVIHESCDTNCRQYAR